MLKVLKASAGSGKTYALAREYIRLLIASDKADAYRHVLAVTFTNKATDEMKRRILQELSILAADPQRSPYREYLQKELGLPQGAIQARAARQLGADFGNDDFEPFSAVRCTADDIKHFTSDIGLCHMQVVGIRVILAFDDFAYDKVGAFRHLIDGFDFKTALDHLIDDRIRIQTFQVDEIT